MMAQLLCTTIFLTCAVLTYGSTPFRGDCKREAKFKKASNESALTNHVIATLDVTSGLDCTLECLQHPKCVSYNYQITDSPTKKCELSDQTKTSKPSDYVIKAGYSYHDAEEFVLPVCAPSSPCLNGATCIDVCRGMFVCQCVEGYIGEKCETWIGCNGSSAKCPGKSCLSIKHFWKGTGDGKYWIDPLNKGQPMLVTCDMTTDGGGWLLVKNLTLPKELTSNLLSVNYVESTNSYEKISNLETYEWLADQSLMVLKNDIGFTQLRYYCYMASVGRVFHIMTNRNDKGYEVLRFFLESASPTVAPCQTFTALPDDNSTISRNCDQWGYTKDSGEFVNVWGDPEKTGSMRVYTGIAKIPGQYAVKFGDKKPVCDHDEMRYLDRLRSGDSWKLFVR